MTRSLAAVLVLSSISAVAVGCKRSSDVAKPVPMETKHVAPIVPADECPREEETAVEQPVPEHVARIAQTELYLRAQVDGGPGLVVAGPQDLAVVRSYPTSRVRGPIAHGMRITLMAARRTYRVNEEVRVIHVVEYIDPGQEVFVMGPKAITGEFLDGHLIGAAVPPWGAFTSGIYDGAVMKSPWVDTNYEITGYPLNEPGLHRIQWRAGTLASNELCVRVVP